MHYIFVYVIKYSAIFGKPNWLYLKLTKLEQTNALDWAEVVLKSN